MMLTPVTAVPYFDELGSGEATVLMLHGIGGGRRAFVHQMRPLADAGYQAVAWDMPGYGHSAVIDPYSFETLADECIELIDVLDPGKLVVVGHSMGGMVAQEVASRVPRRIDALVLAGTCAAFGNADGEWQRRFIDERTVPLAARGSMADVATRLVPAMLSPDAPDSARAEAIDVMSQIPPRSYRLALQALTGFDRRADLATLPMPVLLVAGADDRSAPPSLMREMAGRIPLANYVCLERCGHLMPLEQPEAFNDTLLGFLQSVFVDGGASR